MKISVCQNLFRPPDKKNTTSPRRSIEIRKGDALFKQEIEKGPAPAVIPSVEQAEPKRTKRTRVPKSRKPKRKTRTPCGGLILSNPHQKNIFYFNEKNLQQIAVRAVHGSEMTIMPNPSHYLRSARARAPTLCSSSTCCCLYTLSPPASCLST